MAGYIGNKAVGLNVTTGDILGDVGVGGDLSTGTLKTSGQLSIATTSAGNSLGSFLNQGTGANFYEASDGTKTMIAGTDGGNDFVKLGSLSSHPVGFVAGNSEKFRIATDGSLSTPTAGTSNVRFGVNAGNSIASGGNYNVFLGDEAGTACSTGDANVGIGFNALKTQITTGINTAVGFKAGESITSGVENNLFGSNAGDSLTDADYNVAMGVEALAGDTKGSKSVAIGHRALFKQNFANSTDTFNTAVGYTAGQEITTGVQNTLIGALCCGSMTTNREMTVVGFGLASGATTGRTREIVIGSNGTSGGSNTARFITSAGSATLNIDGSDTSWAAASDLRLKKEVANSTVGLNFIKDLRPVTFKWNAKNAIENNLPQYNANSSDPVYGEGKAHHGFIAQEVKTVIDNHSDVVNGHNLWSEDPDGTQQIAPSALVPMLVKALQELSAKNDALEARIAVLEG